MALNISIWQGTLVENFYPDNSFASKSVDDSCFVKARKVIIPNAGKPSNVKKNRTAKPATVNSAMTSAAPSSTMTAVSCRMKRT